MIFVRVDIDLRIGQFQICDRIDRFYQLMGDLVAELCGGNPTLGGKIKNTVHDDNGGHKGKRL